MDAVHAAADRARDEVEERLPVLLRVLDRIADDAAHRKLVPADEALEAPSAGAVRGPAQIADGRAVRPRHAFEQRCQDLRVRAQPHRRRLLGRELAVEDAVHQVVLHRAGEREVAQEAADIGAFLQIALAYDRMDDRAAEVRAEGVVAAREIAHVVALVHRVRLPTEEHDGFAGVVGALDLRQHALFARLDQREATEPEAVRFDELDHHPVAVVAGLDAVHLAFERFCELRDVGEVAQPLVVEVGRHGEGVLRLGHVGAHDLDRTVVEVGLAIGLLRGHPVPEEDVDVAVAQGGEGDGQREDRDLGLVAELPQHMAREARRGGDIRPADV